MSLRLRQFQEATHSVVNGRNLGDWNQHRKEAFSLPRPTETCLLNSSSKRIRILLNQEPEVKKGKEKGLEG